MKSPVWFVSSLALLAAAQLSRPLAAQVLAEGFASTLTSLPSGSGSLLLLANGQYSYFDGSDLWLAGGGQPPRSLLQFAVPVFGSMTIEVAPGLLLFGESSTQGIWLVPLQGPPPSQPVTNLTFNYDAVLFAPGEVLISAKTTGFGGPDNHVYHVDIHSGNTRLVAQIPGASGPLALLPNGDVLYATGSLLFPTPPGQVQLLRLPRSSILQALAAQTVLGPAQAQVLFSGLDAASTLACDDDGNAYFSDWYNQRLGVVRGLGSNLPSLASLGDYATATAGASAVQFLPGNQQGSFAPFQPANGTLFVHETSWAATNQVRALQAQRPLLQSSASSPVPAGGFQLAVQDGPANGLFVLALSLPPTSPQVPLQIAGFAQPLWWELGAGNAVASFLGALDATGAANLSLLNPGALPPVPFLFQVACVNASFDVVASTAAVSLLLGQ